MSNQIAPTLVPQFIPYNGKSVYTAGAGNALSMISLFNGPSIADDFGSEVLWILFLLMWLILETLYIFMIQYVKCLSCCCKDIERDNMFNGLTAAYNDSIQSLSLYFVNGMWTDPYDWVIGGVGILAAPLITIAQFMISAHTTLMAYWPCKSSKCNEKYALPSLIALTQFINIDNIEVLFAIFAVVFDNNHTCKIVRNILEAINNPDNIPNVRNIRKNRAATRDGENTNIYDFVTNLLPSLPNHPRATTIKNTMVKIDINAIKANHVAQQTVENTPQ